MKKRVVFFGDSNSYITTILFESFVQNLENNFELIAVVNTTPKQKRNTIKNILVYMIKKLFNPFDKNIIYINYKNFLNLASKDIKVIHSENVNEKEFVREIKKLNPDYAFLMGCPQIFKKNIISCFDKVVNYHNSYLPTYRGLEATSWAMTYSEKYTGYTFHYVNENVDDGNIVFQEKIEIDYSKSSLENELFKTKKASNNISKVLRLVLNKFEGKVQEGIPSYFGSKQKKEILTFNKFEDIAMIQRLTNIWGGYNYSQIMKPYLLQR